MPLSGEMARVVVHVAITMNSPEEDISYAAANNKTLEQVYAERNSKIHSMIKTQVSFGIPVMTIFLMSAGKKNPEQLLVLVSSFTKLFQELNTTNLLAKNRIKASVLGKWYDLPGGVVEEIKTITGATSDFDSFFLNLCINYDGQAEIVDACKLIAMKARAGKLEPESVTAETIKENLYSSSMPPPQLIIKNNQKKISSLLFWDTVGARIYFTGKPWQDFHKEDLVKALES